VVAIIRRPAMTLSATMAGSLRFSSGRRAEGCLRRLSKVASCASVETDYVPVVERDEVGRIPVVEK
jgi:hypothetical protein